MIKQLQIPGTNQIEIQGKIYQVTVGRDPDTGDYFAQAETPTGETITGAYLFSDPQGAWRDMLDLLSLTK